MSNRDPFTGKLLSWATSWVDELSHFWLLRCRASLRFQWERGVSHQMHRKWRTWDGVLSQTTWRLQYCSVHGKYYPGSSGSSHDQMHIPLFHVPLLGQCLDSLRSLVPSITKGILKEDFGSVGQNESWQLKILLSQWPRRLLPTH